MEKKEMKVGTILVSEWGYEQTNVNFYRVTKVTPKSVKVIEIGKNCDYNSQHMTGVNVPLPDVVVGREEITRRVKTDYKGNPYINLTDYKDAEIWNGEPRNSTHYA